MIVVQIIEIKLRTSRGQEEQLLGNSFLCGDFNDKITPE